MTLAGPNGTTMLSIAPNDDRAQRMSDKHIRLNKVKELVCIKAIAAAKAAGDELIYIRKVLAPATKTNPLETDIGTFISFSDYLTKRGWNHGTAYRYIKLAENWDIVLKLGMQDKESSAGAMRLCRTLKVIEWYNQRVKEGIDPETLTLERYWSEQEKPSGHTVKELLIELAAARAELTTTRQQADRYKEQYEQLKLQFEAYLETVAPAHT